MGKFKTIYLKDKVD